MFDLVGYQEPLDFPYWDNLIDNINSSFILSVMQSFVCARRLVGCHYKYFPPIDNTVE